MLLANVGIGPHERVEEDGEWVADVGASFETLREEV